MGRRADSRGDRRRNAVAPAGEADLAPSAQAKDAGDTRPRQGSLASLVAADIALRGGGRLLRLAVERALRHAPDAPAGAGKSGKRGKSRSLARSLVGSALARIAMRSAPGAILIGGGLLAKALHDRRKNARKARPAGKAGTAARDATGA